MYLTTRDFAPFRRQAIWREAVFSHCGEFQFEFDSKPVEATLQLRRIGSLQCARLDQSLKRVFRADPQAMQAQAEDAFLLMQVAGRARLSQFDREASLSPGDVAVIDAAAPFEMSLFDRNSQICVHVPKDRLADRIEGWELAMGRKVSPSTSFLLHSLVSTAFSASDCISDGQGEILAEAFLALLGADQKPSAPLERSGAGPEALQKIKNYIISNLADENLTPRKIASATAVSERHLHRIFNARGESVAHWIKQCRLERCASDLRNPGLRERSITEIAFGWGFNDSAHFSRVFRKQFGIPPREYRRAGLTH